MERTGDLMNKYAEDCLVKDFESLTEGLDLPNKNKHQVLAVATGTGVDVFLTRNLEDFSADKLAVYEMQVI